MRRAAESRGMEVIIAGAGGAAHLPGMVAAHTLLPVLGVPVESQALKGMDSLLSIVQMPGGVPVGTLAIGKAGATNAALLAVAILANHAGRTCGRSCGSFAKNRPNKVKSGRRCREARPILPGAAIGVLGSGQLGRMFAIAARRMGYRVHTLFARSRHADRPGGRPGIIAPYDDLDAVREFRARRVDGDIRVRKCSGGDGGSRGRDASGAAGGHVLHTTQHRLAREDVSAERGFAADAVSAGRSVADSRSSAKSWAVRRF